MDILKYCSERICDSPFDVRKHIAPLVGAALVSGASTLLSNEMNRANAQYSFNKQKEYNNWLLGHQTQEEVADARAAGLNPAFMNGSQLGAAPSPPSYDTPEFENPFDLSNLMMFGKLAADTEMSKANASYMNEQAEGLRIENERRKAEDKEVSDYLNENVTFDNVDQYLKEHGELPSTIIISSKGATGRLSAKQRIKQYEAQIQDVSINAVRNEFESMVTNAQITNPKVMAAIEDMPYRSWVALVHQTANVMASTSNLEKEGAILDIEKVTAQLEQDIQRDSNIYQYIDKLFSGDFEWKDLAKVAVMMFTGAFGKLNFAPLGTRKTSSSNTNSSNVNSTSQSTVNSTSRSRVDVYPHSPR